MSSVSARRYGAVVAVNVLIGVIGAVLPTFTHASTPWNQPAGVKQTIKMERRVEHTQLELIRNGGFHFGRAHWVAGGGANPHLWIVEPGMKSRHAARLVGSKRGSAALAERLTMRPAAKGDRYSASAMVDRLGSHRTDVVLRVNEVWGGLVVGHRDRHMVLRRGGWHQLSMRYSNRQAGSKLVVQVVAPSLRHKRGFDVDRVRVVQTRRVVHFPVTVTHPDPPSPNPSPSSSSPAGPSPTPTGTNPANPSPTPTGSTPAPSPTSTPTVPAPVTTPSGSCTISSMMVPSCGVLWGVYKPESSGETWATDTTDLESQLGRPLDIVYRYHDFSTTGSGVFPDASEEALAASGHIIFDDWAPKIFSTGAKIQWADIAAGNYDASVIDPEAERIKAYGKPIMLSFDHEMDARVGVTGTAAQYVAAYQHIENTFDALGVTNVIWVWTTTGYSGHDSEFASLYPGNSYVDWIGYDPYNFGSCKSDAWKTFQQTIDPMYQWLESNGFGDKPFILPEYGTVPDPSDSSAAAQWYTQVPSVLASHPNIKAVVAWDDQVGTCDTELNAQPGELAAFAAAGLAPSVQSGLS
jgi:hypothetical protein